jgi:hypothetical protein
VKKWAAGAAITGVATSLSVLGPSAPSAYAGGCRFVGTICSMTYNASNNWVVAVNNWTCSPNNNGDSSTGCVDGARMTLWPGQATPND